MQACCISRIGKRHHLVRTQQLLLQQRQSCRHFRLMQPLRQLQQQHHCRSFLHTYGHGLMHIDKHQERRITHWTYAHVSAVGAASCMQQHAYKMCMTQLELSNKAGRPCLPLRIPVHS